MRVMWRTRFGGSKSVGVSTKINIINHCNDIIMKDYVNSEYIHWEFTLNIHRCLDLTNVE